MILCLLLYLLSLIRRTQHKRIQNPYTSSGFFTSASSLAFSEGSHRAIISVSTVSSGFTFSVV